MKYIEIIFSLMLGLWTSFSYFLNRYFSEMEGVKAENESHVFCVQPLTEIYLYPLNADYTSAAGRIWVSAVSSATSLCIAPQWETMSCQGLIFEIRLLWSLFPVVLTTSHCPGPITWTNHFLTEPKDTDGFLYLLPCSLLWLGCLLTPHWSIWNGTGVCACSPS